MRSLFVFFTIAVALLPFKRFIILTFDPLGKELWTISRLLSSRFFLKIFFSTKDSSDNRVNPLFEKKISLYWLLITVHPVKKIKIKTKFLKRSEELGATIKNGLNMLENQAEESWKLWNS